jgi:hypothetical protein
MSERQSGPLGITVIMRKTQVKPSYDDQQPPPQDMAGPLRVDTSERDRLIEVKRVRTPAVSLAPPSLNALMIHRAYPITATTRVKGTKLLYY